MADEPRTAEDALEERFWDKCAAIQPALKLPGYWETLNINCLNWADEVTVSQFWRTAREREPDWSRQFKQANSGNLLARNTGIPGFSAKETPRIKEKIVSFCGGRKRGYDPHKVWDKERAPVPILNDLVRTRVECQFMDGVQFFG